MSSKSKSGKSKAAHDHDAHHEHAHDHDGHVCDDDCGHDHDHPHALPDARGIYLISPSSAVRDPDTVALARQRLEPRASRPRWTARRWPCTSALPAPTPSVWPA